MTTLPTDPAANLASLIRCPSVTPDDAGALDTLAGLLHPLGFAVEKPVFSDAGTPDVANLFAKLGTVGRHLVFAGHTDVVPPGDEKGWTHGPFSAEIADGLLYGRGAVDMKGGIACFVAALARLVEADGAPPGQVSLLITGDEEGPAINGTAKLLDWARERGERFDACLVGEPTNPQAIGDMVKIGRRGSLSGVVTIEGRQGHVAYPHLADNPLRTAAAVLDALYATPFDAGTERFQPTNLEVTTIDTANPSVNVVPGRATIGFNVRFNDLWSVDGLKAEITRRLDTAMRDARFRPARAEPAVFEIAWRDRPSPVFLTEEGLLTGTLAAAIETVTGKRPELSTSGGTSDARFIKDYCPVVEFGLVGQTMHMIDECVPLADLERLTAIYEAFIAGWFSSRE